MLQMNICHANACREAGAAGIHGGRHQSEPLSRDESETAAACA